MSQTSFLQDVESWSTEKCKENVADILPRLTRMFTNGCSTEKKISLLRVMTRCFLPVLTFDQFEVKFSSVVFPETHKLYDALLATILSALEDEAAEISDVQEMLQETLGKTMDVLASLELTLLHVVRKSEGSILLSGVRSIPLPILSIIRKSFEHCKESNAIYGSHFEALSEQLSLFFKKTFVLQKALMAMLDVVDVQPSIEENQQIVIHVSKDLHDLCAIIGSMDASLMASTWKFLVKFVTKHKDCLDGNLQVPAIIRALCWDIKSHFQRALIQAPLESDSDSPSSQGGRDKKVFSKTAKICGLYAKMLLHMLKEFESILGECTKELYNLVVLLFSHSPPSLHTPHVSTDCMDELKGSFLVCVEPLLQRLIPCRTFCDTLLNPKQKFDEEILPFGYLLTLLNVLQLLPKCDVEIQDKYNATTVFPEDPPKDSILRCILHTVAECHSEFLLPVMMPGVMHDGKPQSKVSLHEYVVTHLNGFVATVTPKQFSKTEGCLLDAVIGDSFTEASVAMDVWCFVARYGTAETCYSHCKFLARLVKSVAPNQSPGYSHLCLLLQRLVPLMADSSKVDFVQEFPPNANRSLWSRLPLQTFPAECKEDVCHQLSVHYLNLMDIWSKSKNIETILSLQKATVDLCKVFDQFKPGSPPIQASTMSRLAQCTLVFVRSTPLEKATMVSIGSPLFKLCGHLLLEFKFEDLELILQTISSASSSSVALRFSSISLLCKIGQLDLTNHPQQQQMLHLISKLFSSFLTDDNPVIQQLVLEAFSRFAEETVHESLVPECLQDDITQNKVVEFLNQDAVAIPPNKSEVELLREQSEVIQNWEKLRSAQKESDTSHATTDSDDENRTDQDLKEPQPKRQKVDCERSLQVEIKQVAEGLRNVKKLLVDLGYKPPWLAFQLGELSSSLTEIEQS